MRWVVRWSISKPNAAAHLVLLATVASCAPLCTFLQILLWYLRVCRTALHALLSVQARKHIPAELKLVEFCGWVTALLLLAQ
jgi:hypothetical protein